MLEAGSLSHPRLLLVAEMPPVAHRPAEDLRRHITFTSSPGIRQALTRDDIAQARRHVRELTKVGEREIHEVALSCARARRQLLTSVHTTTVPRH